MENVIKIRGARQHNLKNINLDIPKNKLIVFTGVSGSGKSSLAFDTIYAEGQRRYVESLSTYARQFLGVMEKPDVDAIEGLSPAISIDQKTTSRNPRSIVGTITEIYDYMRLLFARVGHPHCPICGREISSQSVDQIVNAGLTLIEQTAKTDKKAWFLVLSPIVSGRKGEFSSLFENLKAKGFRQVRVDGQVKSLSEDFLLIKTNKHSIEAVVDRLSLSLSNLKDPIFKENLKSRISDSIEQALKLSDGNIILSQILDKGFELPEYPKKFTDHLFSEKFACPVDNIQIPEVEPRTFSFNSPYGACPNCSGLGKILKVEPHLIFSEMLSITEGGILPFASMFEHETWFSRIVFKMCEENGINPRAPISSYTKEQKIILLYGTGDKLYQVFGRNRFGKDTFIWAKWLGVVPELERRHVESTSDYIRMAIEKYMRERLCEVCNGARLKKEALGITINELSISQVTDFSITKAAEWIEKLPSILNEREKEIARLIHKEISSRLNFLKAVGLEYLTLSREAGTLSGGEAQRIRLASQIGSGLTGVLYVLDEPTIGLHMRDNQKLIDTLKRLRDLGNTVIVVEHDRQMIEQADHVFDFGPGAGRDGGILVAEGTPSQISKNPKSLTGQYLSGKRKIDVGNWMFDDEARSSIRSNFQLQNPASNLNLPASLTLVGCNQFNLKNINVEFPLSKFVVITGVSGSGKSTLLVETLFPALSEKLNPFYRGELGKFKSMEGVDNVDKVILIDQSPIGRTPRSNPATYTGVFGPIRDVYALTKDAKSLGFKKGRFSFNVKGGRCEACEGQGQIKIEMQFMSDIWVTCEVCQAKRYNNQTLEISYKGKNISEVLNLTVTEAKEFFHAHSQIVGKLETLEEVGLGYMELGQPATTLSGGEAQRVKLASELSKKATGSTVYILDEPTTGLHFADIEKLLKVLKLLVSRGNSVFIIEHNPDVIKNADWIIDLGPEGGDNGGEVVAKGTTRDIAKSQKSYTGQLLRNLIY
ncbi:excinuclease ABC subunit UvrA [Patescibacteria group bacterium]|nr:excinuclease ABC subunit UvrA [Patescibacteria group bacterium]